MKKILMVALMVMILTGVALAQTKFSEPYNGEKEKDQIMLDSTSWNFIKIAEKEIYVGQPFGDVVKVLGKPRGFGVNGRNYIYTYGDNDELRISVVDGLVITRISTKGRAAK